MRSNNADEMLCKYLQDVSRTLKSLSSKQRDAELRELRAHLEQIVAREIENGAAETSATKSAIAQFGSARNVGRALAKSHRPYESWLQAIVTLAACLSVQLMCSGITSRIPSLIDLQKTGWDNVWFFCHMFLPFILVGILVKTLSPRRAPMVLLMHSAAFIVFIWFSLPRIISAVSPSSSPSLAAEFAQQNLTELVFIIGAFSLTLTSTSAFCTGWLQRQLSRAT